MDLNGWDSAYAVNLSYVNAILSKPANIVSQFNQKQDAINIAGCFSGWEIVAGGSGQLLHLELKIASGTLTGLGNAADLAKVSAKFEVNLSFLPTDLPNKTKLVLNLKSVGKEDEPSKPGVIKPLNGSVIDPNGELSFAQKSILLPMLAQFLVDNDDNITFAFANVNAVSPDKSSSWLAPTACAYNYYTTGNGQLFLVVFAVTNNKSPSGLKLEVDSNLVSGTGNAYYGISQAMFLEHVVLPSMTKVYPGNKQDAFSFDAKNNAIVNKKHISLPGKKSGAITYYPVITSLKITLSASKIKTVASGSCDLKMGMSMTFSVTSNCSSSFDGSSGKLTIKKDAHPSTSHDAHIPWYDYLMGPIPDLIMAIVVPIVADGIASGLDASINTSFCEIGPLLLDWPGMTHFEIAGGELNAGFQMFGNVS